MPRKNETRNVLADTEERWISVTGEITAATATNFEKQLEKLSEECRAPVAVFLESPGGDSFACLKMYYLIKHLSEKETPVHTVGIRTVESGTFFLLQAGTRRFATRETRFKFHRATRTYEKKTMNSAELARELHQLGMVDGAQLLLYTRQGHPISKIHELFGRDAKIGTKDALKLNLLDAVIPRDTFSRMRSRVLRER